MEIKTTKELAQQKYCPSHGKTMPCQGCQDLMNKTYKETPTVEEWEAGFHRTFSNRGIGDEFGSVFSDCNFYEEVIEEISRILTSHDAELRRKIEALPTREFEVLSDEPSITVISKSAVLALLGKENV